MTQLTVEHLIERLGRNHRTLPLDITDIAKWCYEAMEDHASYEHFDEVTNAAIEVTDGVAHLPINIYRLLAVRSGCGACDEACYRRASRCLHFPLHTNGYAYVDYIAFPSDDRGYPLIDDSLINVCYWYCLKMLMLDPYLKGNVQEGVFNRVVHEMEKADGNARASFRNLSSEKLNRINRLMRSSVIARQFRLH